MSQAELQSGERSAASPVLRLEGVVKRFGDHTVLDGIDLEVGRHEVVVLIGASGSGKSTLLKTINLLEQIDDGRILLSGKAGDTLAVSYTHLDVYKRQAVNHPDNISSYLGCGGG